MSREIKDIDLDLLKECCEELNIELTPSSRDDCIVLIDKEGNCECLDYTFNMFDYGETQASINVPYLIIGSSYVKSKSINVLTEYSKESQYRKSGLFKYVVSDNKYKEQNICVA